jgi:hypothetical protein
MANRKVVVNEDGTVVDLITGQTWASVHQYFMSQGQIAAESLGISDSLHVKEVSLSSNTVVAELQNDKEIKCKVTPQIAAALQESDFGRKEPYCCHIGISSECDTLFVWKLGADDEIVLQEECSPVLTQILIALGCSYDY